MVKVMFKERSCSKTGNKSSSMIINIILQQNRNQCYILQTLAFMLNCLTQVFCHSSWEESVLLLVVNGLMLVKVVNEISRYLQKQHLCSEHDHPRSTVHPKFKNPYFSSYPLCYLSIQIVRCELPSLGDIGCSDVCLVFNIMGLDTVSQRGRKHASTHGREALARDRAGCKH